MAKTIRGIKRIRSLFDGTLFYVFKEGDLTAGHLDRWMKDERGRVFVRCLSCRAILKISKNDIRDEGYISPCIVCTVDGCGNHQWIKLKDYLKQFVKK